MLLGFPRVGFGDEPLVDFYFCLVLWTHWWLLVVTVVTFPSEDPMSNQVPFGQLSWLVVVGYLSGGWCPLWFGFLVR